MSIRVVAVIGRVRAAVHLWLRLVRLLPLGGTGPLVALLVTNLALGVLPIGFLIAMSRIVGLVPAALAGGLASPAWRSLVSTFVVGAAVFVGQAALAPVQGLLGEEMTRRVDGVLQARLIEAALRSDGIGPMEEAATLDALDEVCQWFEARTHTPGSGCAGLLALVARYVRLVGLVVIVGVVGSWAPALALAAAVLTFRTGQRSGMRAFMGVYDTWVRPALWRAAYLRDVATGPRHAKELRVYGLTAWFFDRYAEQRGTAQREVARARRRALLRPYLWYTLIGLLAAGYAFVALGTGTARDHISVTGLALGLQATTAALLLGSFYPEADLQTSLGMRTLHSLDAFSARMTAAQRRAPVPPAVLPRVADRGPAIHNGPLGVRFQGVTFRYPGAARPVLHGLDLELPAGRSTAIVGLNGAGKTTLVKLLARLYEPDEGSITVDGKDIRDLPVEQWRRHLAVVFQDFIRYELSAADNIAFGAVHVPARVEAVREAARRANVLDVLDRYPRGLDTMLSRGYDDGVDLSGGQWQRIAIARAWYAVAAGAGILVLDEPTSALDVRAESAFFDSFLSVAGAVTSVLISHRFSTVRRAESIVVLSGGRVVEQGSHDDLMATDSEYRRLYELQARRFAAGLNAEGDIDESRFSESGQQ